MFSRLWLCCSPHISLSWLMSSESVMSKFVPGIPAEALLVLSWKEALLHTFAGYTCVCTLQYAVNRCRLMVSPWATFRHQAHTRTRQLKEKYWSFYPSTYLLDKYDLYLLKIDQLKRCGKKSLSWGKIHLLFTTRRYQWSMFTYFRVLNSFHSLTTGNVVPSLIRREIMHCGLMARFVFMLWVFSVLVF